MGMKLFASDASDDNNSEDISKIEINKDFARRYEHNKKREDLHRLEELKKKGFVEDSSSDSDSDSSSDEVDEDDIIDSKFFDALIKVKNQDPSLKLKDTKLFESSDEEEDRDDEGEMCKGEEEEKAKKGKKKKKPMYLKDVMAKHLIESGPEFGERDEGEKPKSYADEQEELRRAFLDAAEEAEGGDNGEFLKLKQKTDENEDDDDVVENDNDVEFQNKLDQCFGRDEELDENSRFLRDYISKKMWVDKWAGEEALGEDLVGFSEDEEVLEKQEEYERVCNFRFEEGAGDRVLGHARFVEGSVRKKSSTRKMQRKRKEERMAQAEFERKEELKHLKRVKREEIIEKRNKIKEIAGMGGDEACAFRADDLEDDFDPEEYDRKMKDIFGENYYNAEDNDPEFGIDVDEEDGDLEKPKFEKEDELLGIPKNWDVCPSGKEFLAERERILKRKVDVKSEKQKDEDEDEGGGKKRSRDKELADEEMEEIYKLDYEDTIGELKTRFKYAKVNSNRYGLKPEELLVMDENELNQYVSLKKLAPYRDSEWKVPNSKRYEQKMRNRLLLKGEKLVGKKASKRKRSKEDDRSTSMTGAMEEEKDQLADSIGDVGNASRRSRKKRGQEELKLPVSRLFSYGKIPSKPKNKAKTKNKAKH